VSRVLGIDLSLIRPGIAVIDRDLPPLTGTLHLPSIKKPCKAVEEKPARGSRPAKKAKAAVPMDLEARWSRIRITRDRVRQLVAARPTTLAVMERMYVDRASDDLLERAWAWGILAEDLSRLGVPVVMVAPSTLKLYATQDAKASKEQMLEAARWAWPDVEIEDHNAADAIWLAAAGARHCGWPVESVPAVQAAALGAVEWPELLSDDLTDDDAQPAAVEPMREGAA
jgi:Holliday junction resolvasome RuvABC endonuclease subunit